MALRLSVIITAAGSSERFNAENPNGLKKEFAEYSGHSVLYHACIPFLNREDVVAVFVTYKAGTKDETRKALENLTEQKKVPFFLVEGGATRQESVYNALHTLYTMNDNLDCNCVCIHDGARPFVTDKLISDTVNAAIPVGGAIPVLKVTDTMVSVDTDGFIKGTIDRNGVCRVQTPQVFAFPQIYEAHESARLKRSNFYTDDAQIFRDYGYKVITVEGIEENVKITYAKDLK